MKWNIVFFKIIKKNLLWDKLYKVLISLLGLVFEIFIYIFNILLFILDGVEKRMNFC